MKAGCEAIVHSVAHTLDDPNPHPDSRGILQLNCSNVFNSISRSCMFEEFRARIRSLSVCMESCYGSQPVFHFGEHTISADVGSNRVILWVCCVSPSPYNPLLKGSRGKCQTCTSMFGIWMTVLCAAPPRTY